MSILILCCRSQFSAKDPTRPNNPAQSVSRQNSRSNVNNQTGVKQTPSTPTSHKPGHKHQPQQIISKTETFSSSTRRTETIETEIVSNGNSAPTTTISSSVKTVNSNGHHHVDTPDRAAPAKQNIIEARHERPEPVHKTSVHDNNNINISKNNNSNSSLTSVDNKSNETMSQISHSRDLSLTSVSDDLPSFSSSIDDMELRDLRRVKRDLDLRLVDREDQVIFF